MQGIQHSTASGTHIADARLAISEADDAETVERIYTAVVKQLQQLEAEVPEDLQQARQERIAALTGK